MWYLIGTLCFFCYWLIFFLQDKTTPKNHLTSWIVLIIASATWPLSAPLSMIELINKAKNKKAKNKQDESEVENIEAQEISNTVNSN